MRIEVAIVDTVPLGVDTPADLERARQLLAGRKRPAPMADRKAKSAPPPNPSAQSPRAQGRLAGVYQGEPGANSHLACREVFPDLEPHAAARPSRMRSRRCKTARRELAMIPIENSVAGRVADIHHLLPDVGPAHRRRALPARSTTSCWRAGRDARGPQGGAQPHPGARPVPQHHPRKLGLHAGGRGRHGRRRARIVAETGDPTPRRDRPALAARNLRPRDADAGHRGREHNTTRFVVLSREPSPTPPAGDGPIVTTFVFRVRNVPAALYKAMGGFATNGVNMTKLESYMVERPVHRHPVLRRCRGPPRRPSARARARGTQILLFGVCAAGRLQGQPLSRECQQADRGPLKGAAEADGSTLPRPARPRPG